MKIGKISAKIHEIGKIKAILGLGMTPLYGLKNGQIKSLCVKAISMSPAMQCYYFILLIHVQITTFIFLFKPM